LLPKYKKKLLHPSKTFTFFSFHMTRLHASPPSPPIEKSSSFTFHKAPYAKTNINKVAKTQTSPILHSIQIDDPNQADELLLEESMRTNIHLHNSTGANTCIICTFLLIMLIYIHWAFFPDIRELLEQQVINNRVPSFTNRTQYFSNV
jgi:hypothetical protein